MVPNRHAKWRVAAAVLLAVLPAGPCAALSIVWDYSYDASGFFAAPERRSVLEEVSGFLEQRLDLNSSAIVPSGSNHWTWSATNPATGGALSIPDPSTVPGQLTIYVGARSLGGGQLGSGGSVGYSASGTGSWISLLDSTNTPAAYKPFAGTITFNSTSVWHFGTTDPVPSGENDFYSVAAHELGHVLGIGLTGSVEAWQARVDVGTSKYTGTIGTSIYGGQIPLIPDDSHFDYGTSYLGAEFLMDPNLTVGTRKNWTAPELGVLVDMGFVAIPEVGTLGLLLAGAIGLLVIRRYRS